MSLVAIPFYRTDIAIRCNHAYVRPNNVVSVTQLRDNPRLLTRITVVGLPDHESTITTDLPLEDVLYKLGPFLKIEWDSNILNPGKWERVSYVRPEAIIALRPFGPDSANAFLFLADGQKMVVNYANVAAQLQQLD